MADPADVLNLSFIKESSAIFVLLRLYFNHQAKIYLTNENLMKELRN